MYPLKYINLIIMKNYLSVIEHGWITSVINVCDCITKLCVSYCRWNLVIIISVAFLLKTGSQVNSSSVKASTLTQLYTNFYYACSTAVLKKIKEIKTTYKSFFL